MTQNQQGLFQDSSRTLARQQSKKKAGSVSNPGGNLYQFMGFKQEDIDIAEDSNALLD